MTYNSWKLMDKLDVAVRAEDGYSFNGYIVEHGDKDALEKAKSWTEISHYNQEKKEYDDPIKPKVYTFDNEGFSATILDSAGGSSQGGRLSFWRCEVEKDGIKFTIGVNDGILADLIKNSDISNGVIKQKLMFARKGGQPGLIHENMQAYEDATADMKHKADMKKAKKTKKWELGGIYQSVTQTSICLGEVFDTMEEYQEEVNNNSWYGHRVHTVLRKRKVPLKTLAWIHIYRFQEGDLPKDFTELMKKELDDRNYVYYYTGSPPARAKTGQLEVKESDMKSLDKLLSMREDSVNYGDPKIKGRFIRELP